MDRTAAAERGRSDMKRWASVLVVVLAWPLLFAGGGINPPPCLNFSSPTCGYAISNPALSVTVLMDPHMAKGDPGNQLLVDITPNAKQAVLFVRQGTLTDQASVKM